MYKESDLYEELKEEVLKQKNFYIKKDIILGYDVEIFYYYFSDRDAFLENDILRFARGLTFIHHLGAKLLVPHLPKFFNYGEIKSKEHYNIESISIKEDGSAIMPVVFPNNKIVCKTLGSFKSEQAINATEIIKKDEKLQKMILDSHEKGNQLIFEYVGPFNQIVLQYKETSLILIQTIDSDFNIIPATPFDYKEEANISDIEKWLEHKTDIEGFVIQFTDGQMVKIKTNWYSNRHRVMAPNSLNPKHLMELIINNELDDVLPLLNGESLKYAENFKKQFNKKFFTLCDDLENFVQLAKNFEESRKEFAIKYSKLNLFSYIMKHWNNFAMIDIHESIIHYVCKAKTNKEILTLLDI